MKALTVRTLRVLLLLVLICLHPTLGFRNAVSATYAQGTGQPAPANKFLYIDAGQIFLVDEDGSNPQAAGVQGQVNSAASFGGKKIAYSALDGTGADSEIFVADIDGGNAFQLTDNDSVNDSDPAWSPDGSKIAYDSGLEIFVMNAEGSGKTQLTSLGRATTPTWSPDGERIAFDAWNPSTYWHVYIMDADGNNQIRITPQSYVGVSPAWSPDGNRIAFLNGQTNEVYVLELDTTNIRKVADKCDDAVWMPDGQRLLCADNGIHLVDVNTGGKTRLTDRGRAPAWVGPVESVPAQDPAQDPEQDPEQDIIPATTQDTVFFWDGSSSTGSVQSLDDASLVLSGDLGYREYARSEIMRIDFARAVIDTNVSDEIVEEFDDANAFMRTSSNLHIDGGKLHWDVSRNGGQQYMYREITPFSGDVQLQVVGQIDSWTNNCGIGMGVGDGLGAGASVSYRFYGGGCATNGPLISGGGADFNMRETDCNFGGDWLWVQAGQQYEATLTLEDGAGELSVPDVGVATGVINYGGEYNTLWIGMNGVGDWPQCSGSVESIRIIPLDAGVESAGASMLEPVHEPRVEPEPLAPVADTGSLYLLVTTSLLGVVTIDEAELTVTIDGPIQQTLRAMAPSATPIRMDFLGIPNGAYVVTAEYRDHTLEKAIIVSGDTIDEGLIFP